MNVTVSLYKAKRATRGDPERRIWVLRWFGTDGKRYSKTIGVVGKMTKREAEAIQRDKQSKMDCGVIHPDKPKRVGLEEFLKRDRTLMAACRKATTIRELKTAAQHAINSLGADFDVQRMGPAAVGRIMAHLTHNVKLAPATVRKVIRHLQGAFTRGVKARTLTANPFEGVELPRLQRNPILIYERCEVEAMLAVCPDIWWKALIRLAYTSGFRLGEMLNLLWSDLDLEKGTASVQAKRAGIFRLGDRSYPILEWTSKSYQDRTVPLPDETVAMLQRMKAKSGGSRYVFLSLQRLEVVGRHLAEGPLGPNYNLVNNLQRQLGEIQRNASRLLSQQTGKNAQWPPRSIKHLRKSYGTVMAHHVPMHELRALMGHASIRTTERYYLAVGDTVSKQVQTAFGSGRSPAVMAS